MSVKSLIKKKEKHRTVMTIAPVLVTSLNLAKF